MQNQLSQYAKPFLYKKTKIGQREYKRSIPRFIAISEYGICIKWNADVGNLDFITSARDKLFEYTDGGLDWIVCVLFKEDEKKFSRIKTYFKVTFDETDYINWNKNKKEARQVLDKLRSAINYVCKNSYIKLISTQKEFNNKLEELLK